MIAPPRPALAALEAGVAHVARHGRAPSAVPAERRLAFKVALNVVRELDTLLGHAVAEAAALAGVVLPATPGAPAGTALAALLRVLAPGTAVPRVLLDADRARAGLVRALASPRALAGYRLPASYPHAIGAGYRRAARDLALVADGARPRAGPARPLGTPSIGAAATGAAAAP